ncbi:MAG: helix-turn-helix transcriptional regulator [Byssovorax sp.]
MGRPPKDRSGPATETLTLRLSTADRALLDKLVLLRAEELVDEAVEVTAASFVRTLIRREARARGLLDDASSTVLGARKEPSADEVRAMLLQAIEGGTLQAEIARDSGIDDGSLSKFKRGRHTLSPDSLKRLATAVAKHRL